MAIDSTNSIVYDFLIEPRFRIGRHVLLILMLTGDSAAQSMYIFENHTGKLDLISYIYIASPALVNLSLIYFNIYYLAPRFLLRNKFSPFFVALLGSIVLLVAAKSTVEYSLFVYLDKVYPCNSIALLNYITEIIITTIFVSGSMISILLRMWTADSKRIVDIEGQRLKNSIEEFKEQIDPDLLFNTIQHASEEVKREPRKASDVIMCLSDLLRYELYDCKRAKVILKSDIDFLNDYLELEKTRRGRFDYTVKKEGDCDIQIPPLLFIPFVENAVKHNPESGSNVRLSFRITNGRLRFECENPKPRLFHIKKIGGIGLVNVKRRLDLLFGADYNLSLCDEKEKYTVLMEFKI